MYDWLTYSNQGATRNQPLNPRLLNALAYIGDLGLSVDVYSGGQPAIGTSDRRVGSTRHDEGLAADVRFTHPELGMLDHRNPAHIPILREVVARGRAEGLTGFGMGDGYMGPHGMHIGYGDAAVWGAGGSSANAPDWLREAYYGAAQGEAPTYDASRPPSVFNPPPERNALADLAPEERSQRNRLAMMAELMPKSRALDPRDFMTNSAPMPLIPLGAYT